MVGRAGSSSSDSHHPSRSRRSARSVCGHRQAGTIASRTRRLLVPPHQSGTSTRLSSASGKDSDPRLPFSLLEPAGNAAPPCSPDFSRGATTSLHRHRPQTRRTDPLIEFRYRDHGRIVVHLNSPPPPPPDRNPHPVTPSISHSRLSTERRSAFVIAAATTYRLQRLDSLGASARDDSAPDDSAPDDPAAKWSRAYSSARPRHT